MRCVYGLVLFTVLLTACGDDGGVFQPGGRELGEEVSTMAEYITHSCAGEVQACLIPCPGDLVQGTGQFQ
ncbi:MAG: hypothetical protein ABI333_27830 [bacterium]